MVCHPSKDVSTRYSFQRRQATAAREHPIPLKKQPTEADIFNNRGSVTMGNDKMVTKSLRRNYKYKK
jgi:hypothetical protein